MSSRLEELGWLPHFANQITDEDRTEGLLPYRVATQQRDRFQLLGADGAIWAEARGRLYQRGELPAVGDWVLARKVPGDGDAIIERVLERRSSLTRAAAGRRTESQVIAANLDVVFVVTSANADLNTRRLERYLTMIWDGGARPVIVINKTDLCDEPERLTGELGDVAAAAPVVLTSAIDNSIAPLLEYLTPTSTAAFVGSSGVGKSTLVNALIGEEVQATAEVREDDAKGRHTTTARELFEVPGVALLIDTPGIRELGMWASETGLEATFSEIDERASSCRFRDCSHQSEPGCAVLEAVRSGEVGEERLAAFHKLGREIAHQEERQGEAWRTAQHKKKLSKVIKQVKKLKGR